MLVGIQSQAAIESWGLISTYLEQALRFDPRAVRLDELYQEVALKRLQIWALIKDNVAVGYGATKVVDSDGLRVVKLMFYAGELPSEEMRDALETLEAWAREWGADKLEVQGRLGWLRKLPDFKVSYCVAERDLRSLQ